MSSNLVVKTYKSNKLIHTKVLTPGKVYHIDNSQRSVYRVSSDQKNYSIAFKDNKWKIISDSSRGKEIKTNSKLTFNKVSMELVIKQSKINFSNEFQDGSLKKNHYIVFVNGEVYDSFIKKPKSSNKIRIGEKVHRINAPTSAQWQEEKLTENIKIKKRIIMSDVTPDEALKTRLGLDDKHLNDHARKVALAVLALLLLISFGLFIKDLIKMNSQKEVKQYKELRIDANKMMEKRKKILKKTTVSKQAAKGVVPVTKPKAVKVTSGKKQGKPSKGTPKPVAKKTTNKSASGSKINRSKPKPTKPSMKSQFSRLGNMASGLGVSKTATATGTVGSSNTSRSGNGKGLNNGSGKGSSRHFGSGKLSGNGGLKKYEVSGVSTNGRGSGNAGQGTGFGFKQGKVGYGGRTMGLDDETIVRGGLDREVINRVIKKNQGDMNYCYERVLEASPSLSGRVTVDFTIGASGRVSTARASGLNSKLHSCMSQKIKTWVFPKPLGGTLVDVEYAFNFSPLK